MYDSAIRNIDILKNNLVDYINISYIYSVKK